MPVLTVLCVFLLFAIFDMAFRCMRFERIRVACSRRKYGNLTEPCHYISCPNAQNCAMFKLPEKRSIFDKLKVHKQKEVALTFEYRCPGCIYEYECVNVGKEHYPCETFKPFYEAVDD